MFKKIIFMLVGMLLIFSPLSMAQEVSNQDDYQNDGAVEILTNTEDESVTEDINDDLMNEESLNEEALPEADLSSEAGSGNLAQ